MDVDGFKVVRSSTVVEVVVRAYDTALPLSSHWIDQAGNFKMVPQVLYSQTSIYENVFTWAFDQPDVGSVSFEKVVLRRQMKTIADFSALKTKSRN